MTASPSGPGRPPTSSPAWRSSSAPRPPRAATRLTRPGRRKSRFAGGIGEFCEHLGSGEKITEVIRLAGDGTFTETIPVLDDRGHMTPTEVERTLEVDVAVQWNTGYDTITRSFVNVIATPHHGTHVKGFDKALLDTVNEKLKADRLLKSGDEKVTKDDILEGLSAVVSVLGCQRSRQFERDQARFSASRAAARIVQQVVSTGLKDYLDNPPRGAKLQVKGALEKIVAAAKTRIAAREHRENQRRKSALASSSLPAKLVDCRSADDRSELFIVEGDSALGTAKLARDSEYQALLPIRGKILNVQKSSVADMLKNTECAAIIQVLGAGSGSTFDLDSARYQRIILMADADVDGAHIRTLLLTLFHRYMRPMLEAYRVFDAALPPLHRIRAADQPAHCWCWPTTSGLLRQRAAPHCCASWKNKGQRWKDPVQRYKGLGEMDAGQLAETTMDPRHRILRRIRIEDAKSATDVFSLLMGTEVGPRRDFIVSGASELDLSRIDT